MAQTQEKLDYARAIADWFLEMGDDHIQRGRINDGLKCNVIASGILSSQNRDLVSARIESNLRLVADRLVQQGMIEPDTSIRTARPERCLHVLSEALPAGGLTAMATRWIMNDCSGRVHSVALLSQEIPVPASLQQAVESSGGRIHSVDPASSLLKRAAWLRRLAAEAANFVVLHVEQADVICGVAFGVPGGPPVMIVNHCAHLFWNGASTSDLILNCRGSELETLWSARYRGVGLSRCAIVPIPLLDVKSPEAGEVAKAQSRQMLGVSPDAIVVLTVGASYKYLPIDGLDFLEVWEGILRAVPQAVMLAVGFDGDQRWSDASARVGNRIRTLGAMSHPRLLAVQHAADLYVEAFPFGTTTALLEVGLKGVPVGLAPAQSPPPYGTDGIALDDILRRPTSILEYQTTMTDMCRNAEKRAVLGTTVREAILHHHCGAGWRKHLENAIKSLPRQHTVLSAIKPTPTPAVIHEIWSLLMRHWTMGYESTLESATIRALSLGLRPRLTPAVRSACRTHQALRRRRSVPVPALALLFGVVLPLLSDAAASATFRTLVFLCRGSLLYRVWQKLVQLFGSRHASTAPYQEYRRINERTEPSKT
jgi:hypothetical protein